MGADHTAGISYDEFSKKDGSVGRSLEAQIMYATMAALGYCMLAAPPDKATLFGFLKDLINARYAASVTVDDLVEIGKETLRFELKFNEGSQFHSANEPDPAFIRTEGVGPNQTVFDVDEAEIKTIWNKLDSYKI